MPYSKTPTVDTYSSQQIPLVYDLELKPGNTSFSELFSGMTNVIPVKADDGSTVEWGETRFGLSISNVVSAASGASVRGMFVWEKTTGTTYTFVVVGDGTTTYVITSTGGSFTSVNSWTDSARTPCRFCEFIDSTNVKKLVLATGTRGYVFTDNTAGTQITDADFPNPHIPFPVFLNGRVYLAKSLTGDIYNSALDDPSSWTAGDFISSEVYPDDIQALVKVQNYILAIGVSGSEYFYDAATPTGSPLARQEGAVLPFGTSSPNSIASNKDTVMMLALTGDGDTVFKLIQGLNHHDVGASAVLTAYNAEVLASRATSSGIRGAFMRQNGDLYYLFNFKGDAPHTSATTTPSVLYCFKTKKWVRLTYSTSNTYPVFFTAQPSSTTPIVTYAAGTLFGIGVWFGPIYAGITTDSVIGNIGPVSIQQSITIPPSYFGTMNRKFMSRLGVNYMYPGVETTPDITVSYSDDNMETFSTARTLAGTMYGEFPFITQLGSFRWRGFVITSTTMARFHYLEVDINKGQR